MKPKALVFDLDGVLAELKPESERNNHTGDEMIISSIFDIYEGMCAVGEIYLIILTGRKRKEYGKITEEWLRDNEIFYDELIMQEGSQGEKNHIYKEKELIKLQEQYDIVAVFDDNELLVPVCKRLGILLLQVHQYVK